MVFFAPPNVTPLDLVGPMQAFSAAGRVGGRHYKVEVCSTARSLPVEGNLQFAGMEPYSRIRFRSGDILCVAGFSGPIDDTMRVLRKDRMLFRWLRRAAESGALISSVCTGAYLLAEAGLLDGLECATHWRDIDDLQRRYPRLRVRRSSIFVESGGIYTSAGVAAGIDLAIHLLGLRHGPKLAFEVARQLVVYLRRSGDFEQDSVYLRYRDHIDDLVHRAQSVLVEHLDAPPRLESLAAAVGASPRNLTRRFQRSIGLSVGAYLRELRVEHAEGMLREAGSKVEDVARACGFRSARQLRNLYRSRFGASPRQRRAAAGR